MTTRITGQHQALELSLEEAVLAALEGYARQQEAYARQQEAQAQALQRLEQGQARQLRMMLDLVRRVERLEHALGCEPTPTAGAL